MTEENREEMVAQVMRLSGAMSATLKRIEPEMRLAVVAPAFTTMLIAVFETVHETEGVAFETLVEKFVERFEYLAKSTRQKTSGAERPH